MKKASKIRKVLSHIFTAVIVFLFVALLGIEITGQLIAKVILAVIVVILNYFFSKFIIFAKKKDKNNNDKAEKA